MIRRVIKRMGSIALSALMITSLMVGCSSKNNSGDSVSSDDLKPVELKMYLIGDKPKDFDTVYGIVGVIKPITTPNMHPTIIEIIIILFYLL